MVALSSVTPRFPASSLAPLAPSSIKTPSTSISVPSSSISPVTSSYQYYGHFKLWSMERISRFALFSYKNIRERSGSKVNKINPEPENLGSYKIHDSPHIFSSGNIPLIEERPERPAYNPYWKRRHTMDFNQIKKMAIGMGINPIGIKKPYLIQAIQKAENNFQCFGTSRIDTCNELNCLWRRDCISYNHSKIVKSS